MIVSSHGSFVFFHNPKVAGASVHKSLAPYHDGPVKGWGMGSDGRELAHYGIDEFARLFPAEWDRIRGWKMYSLYRDSYDRFLSSFSQYSRKHGEVDVRFAAPGKVRDYLFEIIGELEARGRAEDIMEDHRLDLFRPQWIYLRSEEHEIDIAAYPLAQIEDMYRDIEARTGRDIPRIRINERERLDLPQPLAWMLSHGRLARKIGQMPGAEGAKAWLKRSFRSSAPAAELPLVPEEVARVRDFVGRFYQRDRDLLPAAGGT